MKKFLKTILATLASCMLFSAAASAQVITNTGPGSNNQVVTNNTRSCSSTNTNVVGVTNTSNQTGSSGSANTSGNTTGGSSTSGSVSNNNNTSTSVAVNNSGCGATTANTPGTTSNPQGGGRGAGAGADAVNGELTSVASLPETGAASPAEYIASGLAALSALAIGGYLAKQYAVKAR